MLDDILASVKEAFLIIWKDYPFLFVIPFMLSTLSLFFSALRRLVFFDGPVSIHWAIKDLFLKIVNKVLPFEWCYKMGWARLGIDFVECESQDCSTCPFNGKCTSAFREDRDV